MRSIFKIILSCLAISLMTTGCSDDTLPEFEPTGTIEEEDGEQVSVFDLSVGRDVDLTGVHKVDFHIYAPLLEGAHSFPGTIKAERVLSGNGHKLALYCRLKLKDFEVANGDYFISITGENLPKSGAFKIRIFDRTITQIARSAYTYDGLQGEGTEANPYLITTLPDYVTFIKHIHNDPDNGFGLYFLLRNDMDLAQSKEDIVGVAPFQGTFDGNGRTLKNPRWEKPSQKYPDSRISEIGLFTILCNATVRNLSIKGADFSNIVSNGGIIAGLAKGSVELENIHVQGKVRVTGENAGGLIGYANGGVTVSGASVDKETTVSALRNAGGFIGRMENVTVTDSQSFDFQKNSSGVLEIPDPRTFTSSCNATVTSEIAAGGITGFAKNSKILHISSSASVSAKQQLGGIVGHLEDTDNSSSLEDCTFTGKIEAPSAECVGGIAGHINTLSGGRLLDCVNYSSITGGNTTGGIIGYIIKSHDTNEGAKNLIEVQWTANAARVEGGNNVGGIVGEIYYPHGYNLIDKYEINIANSVNAGELIARGGDSEQGLGGIVGRTGVLTQIYASANHGKIEARGKLHGVGGIVGRLGRDYTTNQEYICYNTKVIQCINTGGISATNRDSRIGGIAGYGEEGDYQTNGIWDSRNSGRIIADQEDDTGGILGCTDRETTLTHNFNNGKIEHGNVILGTHKFNCKANCFNNFYLEGTGKTWPSYAGHPLSAGQITDKSKYVKWDFDKVWEMTSDGPNLRNNHWRNPASAVVK